MAARRCTLCGISYPDDHFKFQKCPIHGEPTSRIERDPDEDWAARLNFLKIQQQLVEMDTELIPSIEAPVTVESGQLWIHAWDVVRAGIRNRLRDTDLIQIGQQVFEILDYVESTRRYLVRAFATTVTDEDIERISRAAGA